MCICQSLPKKTAFYFLLNLTNFIFVKFWRGVLAALLRQSIVVTWSALSSAPRAHRLLLIHWFHLLCDSCYNHTIKDYDWIFGLVIARPFWYISGGPSGLPLRWQTKYGDLQAMGKPRGGRGYPIWRGHMVSPLKVQWIFSTTLFPFGTIG